MRWRGGSVQRVRQRLETTTATIRDVPFVGRLLTQLVHVNVLDTATRMAAQIFLTAVPTVFILAAFAPDSARNNLVESLRGALGLRPTSLDEFQQIFNATSETVRDATGGIGIVVTLLSATACSRVLQRLCERSWHMSHTGARVAAWRWLAWLLVWLAALLFQGRIHAAFGAGSGLGTALSLVSGTLLWWWTQHVLLGGRIRWLPLLPGAVITGAGLLVFFWASKIYMPHAFDRSITQFGPFGLVFTLLSWLIMICVTITVCIATGYVVASEGHLARLLGTPSAENAAQSAVRTAD